MKAELTDVGVSEEMVRAFAQGKAESLKITVPEGENPNEFWEAVIALIAKFPSVDAMMGVSLNQNVIVFVKK